MMKCYISLLWVALNDGHQKRLPKIKKYTALRSNIQSSTTCGMFKTPMLSLYLDQWVLVVILIREATSPCFWHLESKCLPPPTTPKISKMHPTSPLNKIRKIHLLQSPPPQSLPSLPSKNNGLEDDNPFLRRDFHKCSRGATVDGRNPASTSWGW